MTKRKKIIIWTKGIDNLIGEKGKVGGLTVQMYFWARTFNDNGWDVFSFSKEETRTINNIKFLKFPNKRYIGIFIEWIYSFFYIIKIKPNVIFFRGASRGLSYVSLYVSLSKCKLVFLGASDSDFQPGKELINTKHDKKLFRTGLRNVQYFITQNSFQQALLFKNYKKENSITIPNIWINATYGNKQTNLGYILWVSNFRNLKRPEWFFDLAKFYPDEKFIMVGGAIDKELFENCKKQALLIDNLFFNGTQPFNEVNSLFENSKIFVCTSQIEGFPNTFLQAWSNNIPVITTFDPSDIVKNKQLGVVVNSFEELVEATSELIKNKEMYNRIQQNINEYFNNSHDSQKAFEKVIKMLNV